MAVDAIEITLDTATPPERVWAALTDPARVAEWFTDARPLGPVGSPYRLDFGDGSVVVGRVTERLPSVRFAHTWAWEGQAEPPTVVTWSIEPLEDGGSRVVLRHDGWDESGADRATRDDHAGYWEGYLADLADVLGQTGG